MGLKSNGIFLTHGQIKPLKPLRGAIVGHHQPHGGAATRLPSSGCRKTRGVKNGGVLFCFPFFQFFVFVPGCLFVWLLFMSKCLFFVDVKVLVLCFLLNVSIVVVVLQCFLY